MRKPYLHEETSYRVLCLRNSTSVPISSIQSQAVTRKPKNVDGQNTGVPIATRTLLPVADLASERVQKYTDGQLKWIIDNGIRFSGMPGWKVF